MQKLAERLRALGYAVDGHTIALADDGEGGAVIALWDESVHGPQPTEQELLAATPQKLKQLNAVYTEVLATLQSGNQAQQLSKAQEAIARCVTASAFLLDNLGRTDLLAKLLNGTGITIKEDDA